MMSWPKVFMALGLLVPAITHAEYQPIGNSLPTAMIGPSPVGFVFPGFSVSSGINAAALPLEKATAIGVAFTPATAGEAQNTAFGSVTTSNKKIGIGAGYIGSLGGSQSATGIFAGLGYRFDSLSIGATVRSQGLGLYAQTSADFSAMYTGDSGVTLATVGYDVSGSQEIGVGIGYKFRRNYHFEGDVLAPLKNASSTGYTVLMSGGMSASVFDLFFNLSYLVKGSNYQQIYAGNPAAFSYTLAIAIWVGEHFNFIGQYGTLPGTTLGLTSLGMTVIL